MEYRFLLKPTAGNTILLVLLATLTLLAMAAIASRIALSDIRSQASSTRLNQGLYAAEGGLNLRADELRSAFVGYKRPEGESPSETSPCSTGNVGTEHMRCKTIKIGSRDVTTYVRDITNPKTGEPGAVGAGEDFEGLSYTQYVYRIRSEAKLPSASDSEAKLEMILQSRLVPLFQFSAFYQRDLEMMPGGRMTLNGRVHTNGNLYLNATNAASPLTINGTVSAAGKIARRGKDGRVCASGVNVNVYTKALDCTTATTDYTSASDERIKPFNGKVLPGQSTLQVPAMSSLAPKVGNELWDKADIRIRVKQTTARNQKCTGLKASCYVPGVYEFSVVKADGTTDTTATSMIRTSGVVRQSFWWDKRELRFYDMFDINTTALFDGIASITSATGTPLTLSDESDGGLVIHLSVDDNQADTNNGNASPRSFAFRMGTSAGQAGNLADSGGNRPKGLTVASNQPLYTWGNYNSVNKIPASLLSDAINVLSNQATKDNDYTVSTNKGNYVTSNVIINAAFLSGVDDTRTDVVRYNGGLENYMRFHENWANVGSSPSIAQARLTYNGSFVSLGNSLHTNGVWGNTTYYSGPNRDFNFDTEFLNADKLPPLSPRFVYIRQVNFSREYQ